MGERERIDGDGSTEELAPTVASTGDTVLPALPAAASRDDSRLDRGAPLGRYVILDRVGKGGMGVVYAAYDPTLDRKVAVKLLLGDFHDPDRVELLREAQAMARLQHPNVVAVHDVGRFGDAVFMAMEFVEGKTLSEHLASSGGARRDWRAVVRLFVEAGQGLAAAHRAGLVHRDFKPGNVVVDEDGRPRVLDFGLARAIGGAAGSSGTAAGTGPTSSLLDSHTRTGLKAGTPAYMSPEQIDGIAAGPLSDQFSFCVALWDALYGDLPYAGETLAELRASMRTGRMRAPTASSPVPARVRALLLRGLAEKPENRHPDLASLLAELTAVSRAPRRRLLAWASGALVLLLAAAVAALVMVRQRTVCGGAEDRLAGIWDEQRRADVEGAFVRSGNAFAGGAFQGVSEALDAFAGRWVEMRTDACQATRVRGEQSEDLLDLRMTCLDSRLVELDALVDEFAYASSDLVAGSVRAAQGLTPIDRCADTAALLAPARLPADPAERAKVNAVREQIARAKALGLAGKRAEAVALAEAAVAAPIDFRPARAEALAELGGHYKKTGKPKEAAQTLDRALVEAIASRHPVASVEAADGYFWLDLDLIGDFERARFWLDYGRAAAASIGPDVERDLLLEYSEAALLRRTGDHEGSLTLLSKVQPLAESEPAGRSLLPYVLWMRADVLVALGRHREALAIQERGLEIDQRDLGPDHPDIAFDLQVLARIDQARDELDRAEASLRRAIEIAGNRPAADHVFVADLQANLAETLTFAGRPDEALALLHTAEATKTELLGGDHYDLESIHHLRGDALRASGRHDLALASHREALRRREARLGSDHPSVARTRGAIGRDLLAMGRSTEAVPLLREAIAGVEGEGSPSELAWLRFELARALRSSGGDRDEAGRLVEEARALVTAEGGHPAALAAAIEEWSRSRAI